jgi:hypothetical protein
MKTIARSTLLATTVVAATLVALALPSLTLAQEPGSRAEISASGQRTPVTDRGVAVNGKPVASPPAAADVALDGKSIVVHYSSPRMRGRVIMGGVVPYGKVWRTGANTSTSFVTAGNLKIGDLEVAAGSYTLVTLPAEPGQPWMLIINKQTGQWGTVYKQEMDLGRIPMKSDTLPAPQEDMSISFEKTTRSSTQLHVKWDTTDEWVKIEAAK